MTPQLMATINGIISTEESMRLLELHEMSQCHLSGLQGFKRLHRYKAMDRGRHSIMLRCFVTEYDHTEPNVKVVYDTPTNGTSFADHIKLMHDKSLAHIGTLKYASKMAFDEGEHLLGDYLMKMIEDQSEELEVYYRLWLDVKRENADMNYISDKLHKKYKAKERKYFCYKG